MVAYPKLWSIWLNVRLDAPTHPAPVRSQDDLYRRFKAKYDDRSCDVHARDACIDLNDYMTAERVQVRTPYCLLPTL